MYVQIQIITTEKEEKNKNIIRTLLEMYPYGGMLKEFVRNDTTRFLFLMKRKNLKLMRRDLFLLRECGFDVEEVRT